MDAPALETRDGGVLIRVRVQPKSSRNAVVGEQGGRVRIALTAPPIEGAANEALLKFLAGVLAVKRRQLVLKSGGHAREKTIWIDGAGLSDTEDALRRAAR